MYQEKSISYLRKFILANIFFVGNLQKFLLVKLKKIVNFSPSKVYIMNVSVTVVVPKNLDFTDLLL